RASNPVHASLPNLPPVLSTSLDGHPDFVRQSVLHFTVTATDPEGDRVGLTILNPAPGMQFTPLVGAPSPATPDVRWVRQIDEELHPELVFAANCGTFLRKDVRLNEQALYRISGCAFVVGDVTGDGVLDAVVYAEYAGANAGAIHVFAGASAPRGEPTA